jgi:uncharacterized membrane protein
VEDSNPSFHPSPPLQISRIPHPKNNQSFASNPLEHRERPLQTPIHVREHVETIAKHEQDFLSKRSSLERLADRIAGFAGSFPFVAAHLFFFFAWITLNSPSFETIRHFDPFPYPLLATILALEALLLASFILMRQSGLAKRADERSHLMLQILLLTEKEVSAIVRMNQQIADHIGLQSISKDKEIQELGEPTSIDIVAQTIQENLSPE